jgi:hypothetical protein
VPGEKVHVHEASGVEKVVHSFARGHLSLSAQFLLELGSPSLLDSLAPFFELSQFLFHRLHEKILSF